MALNQTLKCIEAEKALNQTLKCIEAEKALNQTLIYADGVNQRQYQRPSASK